MQGPGSDLQCCANAKIILILILKILSLIRNWWRQGLFWCDFKISGLIYWPLTVFEALTGLKRQGSSPLGAHPLAGSRRQVMAESNWARRKATCQEKGRETRVAQRMNEKQDRIGDWKTNLIGNVCYLALLFCFVQWNYDKFYLAIKWLEKIIPPRYAAHLSSVWISIVVFFVFSETKYAEIQELSMNGWLSLWLLADLHTGQVNDTRDVLPHCLPS